ncbi:MAG: xanthan lyase [Bacteroides sp.]|uniref:golvesin C-terminal-like domain-containing protein n=1 Tax=Bacteroides sp. TaxID=29523 RepID=UPI001B7889FC|nr:xanthan lyase [Bacteroides sp.]MBP6065560.1 xanthan lyase [Bacteroides sp.]
MKSIRTSFLALFVAILLPQVVMAQSVTPEVCAALSNAIDAIAREEISVGKVKIDSVSVTNKVVNLFANYNCSYIPFREDNVARIYSEVRALLPAQLSKHRIQIYTDRKLIEELIPLSLRSKKEKRVITFSHKVDKPLITRLSTPYTPTNGLLNRHIALWQSHGYYYEPKLTRWEWQRARIFQTVEDLYTQSYVLPFLVPMLEQAGANVLIPRERDTQTVELIIDNDGSPTQRSTYAELSGHKIWHTGSHPGFAYQRTTYTAFENPFKEGSFRLTETIKKGKESIVEWVPEIPQTGKYAVYIAYQTVASSTNDALYTVHHKGGTSQFNVNQQMGGGTWIYLGHFAFDAGKSNAGKVTLSNRSSKAGRTVTADAVKIGGGYGNIARRISDEGATENIKSSETALKLMEKQLPTVDYPYETSGYPRFCEAARYWMQWAGIPDSVYSESRGKNDYTDDYKARGLWVNYLAGGSSANPNEQGLCIPLDMAFAFHTDAGTTMNDSIIGTLGIFYTDVSNGMYANGASRYAAHDLTDLIQSNITRDIRTLYEPNWTRRGMWNKSYYEARAPHVPTMLLELLSHQNFADMRYGLDPRFRFTVSRAIYKGILQFVCSQYKMPYVVQPLPVDHLSLRFTTGNEIELSWQPVNDPLEATAKSDSYLVYTRIGDADFDQGTLVTGTTYRTTVPNDVVCSYKVTALNKGGEGFPSEILSTGKATDSRGTVLIVNGFDRISAPADFAAPTDSIAGFLDALDHGVPYKEDISYIGSMKEFRRSIPWMDDDASGFGDSYANYETTVIAGNTFDYPSVHGAAMLKAGYSFVSCSDESIESQTIRMNDYQVVDLILGKECQTKMGRGGITPLAFKTFSKEMQDAIAVYCLAGGNFFVSGAYLGSDLWDNRLVKANEADRKFATEVLKYKWRVGQAATMGKVKTVTSPFSTVGRHYTYYNELNSESYVVEAPDAIEPADKEAATVMRYTENNLSAGVAYKGAYKTYVLGFPFESLRTVTERNQLMKEILLFFTGDASDLGSRTTTNPNRETL